MSKDHHNPSGRAPRLRASDIYIALRTAMLRRRSKTGNRFDQSHDWLRLFALGILLIDLAVLALANTILDLRMDSYWPGMASIFGGLLLAIIIIRIGRPTLYLDWITNGLLCIGLGLLLTSDPLLSSVAMFLLFCVLLISSSVLRIWIGTTLNAGPGTTWLTASGLTGLCCTAFFLVSRLVATTPNPDVALAMDLLLMGISIAGYGVSLRR